MTALPPYIREHSPPKTIDDVQVHAHGDRIASPEGPWITLIPYDSLDSRRWLFCVTTGRIMPSLL